MLHKIYSTLNIKSGMRPEIDDPILQNNTFDEILPDSEEVLPHYLPPEVRWVGVAIERGYTILT